MPEQAGGYVEKTNRILLVFAKAPLDVHEMLQEMDVTVYQAHSCRDAQRFLRLDRVPVILCDAALPDGGWKDILTCIAPLPSAPKLIVSSRLADEHLWAEVLNLGGFDVLAQPFVREEVVTAVSAATRQWSGGRLLERRAFRAAC
jgi:DNA-binding response OmpR family regulator